MMAKPARLGAASAARQLIWRSCDAWIASRVSSALSSKQVRLVPDERPDFEIRSAERVLQFEATEADMEGRRRGDEPDDEGWQPDPVEEWRKRFDAIPAALDRVVSKKLGKDYPPGTALVVYVNLGCYGAYLKEGIPILQTGTAAAKDRFSVVFAMWEGVLYKFWEDGAAVSEQWPYARPDDI
ncbi:hypothetical protein ABIC09_002142 [Bradyrhizobium sp. S3.12.5]|uniref:hypothetical protein n=1 Tax=Bradyrhizobium sp. S3.12.5 TaxID=3156386 RepID=UPI0033987FD3